MNDNMHTNTVEPYCLLTVTDNEFCIATEVLLYSFLKFNPWFQGDIIIIAEELSAENYRALARHYPVKVLPPDPRLRRQVDSLRASRKNLDAVYRRFFSFELFRFSAYERVVYLDSDVYCCACLRELFERPEAFLACPDGFSYSDRLLAAFNPYDNETLPAMRYGRRMQQSFNAGVLSLGPEYLGETSYTALLAMLTPDNWLKLGESIFTDQMALNRYFENRFTPISGRYNYMIFLEEYQKLLENLGFGDAAIVHFAGSIKPWNIYNMQELQQRAPHYIQYIEIWKALLVESRRANDTDGRQQIFRRQKQWIADYMSNQLQAQGRLY